MAKANLRETVRDRRRAIDDDDDDDACETDAVANSRTIPCVKEGNESPAKPAFSSSFVTERMLKRIEKVARRR